MPRRKLSKICFFGGFDRGYPRSDLLRKGLGKLGVDVCLCHVSPKSRLVKRYAILAIRYLRMKRDFKVIFVPEFRHKDVPLAYLLGKLTGKHIVFDPLVSRFDTKIKDRQDASEGSLQAWHNRNLDRLSLTLSDLVLADTQAHADYYIKEYRVAADKLRVLPVGFDEEVFLLNGRRTEEEHRRRPFRVLFFGNYLPLHGVDVIVMAAKLLRNIGDLEFVLIGRGQTFELVERFVKKEGLENVRLLDRVPMSSLTQYLREADVSLGVFGRTEKTQRVVANKIYQSMAVGKTVITSDSAAIREFFTNDENISLVPQADAEALARKIRFFYERPQHLTTIGRQAACLVHENYSAVAIGRMFIAHCDQVLSPQTRLKSGFGKA
ncbi:MAG: glycosyltransferase [Candidatus Krumholzibacteria bacterium]|nr:glycosyltransferase [Candidatus Krumholzibacteria bacterium]